jgi:hypothetical protein
VARSLEPAASLGRATEVQAIDGEFEREPCRAAIVTQLASKLVAALVSL